MFNPTLCAWEEDFTIVNWEQRGTGKSFSHNKPTSLTFEQLVNDGLLLTEIVLQKIGQEKLILVGSSVGSITGSMMAKARPELFYAYVATSFGARIF
jgi:pimeloyl-ACP methyl ester carboxylesterase